MIAALLVLAALVAAAVHSILLALGRSPSPSTRIQIASAATPPAVFVLGSATQLNWSITQAAPYVLGAGIGAAALLVLTPGRTTTNTGAAVGQAAWMLTCLGAVTAERLYPESGRGQAIWSVLALVIFLGTARVGRRWRSTPAPGAGAIVAALGCIGIVLPLVPGVGMDVNGAPGWIAIGPLTGQPGELARLLLVVGTGLMLFAAGPALRAGRPSSTIAASWPLLVAAMIGAYTADFGPVLVLGVAVGIMILLNRPTPKHTAVLLSVSTLLIALTMLSVNRLRERVEQMLHPVAPSGDLHNTGAALRAVAHGGILGTGFGQGNPHAIANIENDFVLAAVAEERGLVGIVIVALLFAATTASSWMSALRATTEGPRLAAAGLTAMLTVQALYVAFATLTVFPITGMVVPFLSHGGSALLGMWASLGLIVGVGSHHVLRRDDKTYGANLTQRMELASTLTATAWVGVVIATALVITTQPAGSAPDAPLWKGALVTGDATPLITATSGRQPNRTVTPTSPYDAHTVTYLDNETGQRSCARSLSQKLIGGQCIPRTVVTSLRDSVQQSAEAAMINPGDAVALDLTTGHVIALYERPRTDIEGDDAPPSSSPIEIQSAPGSTFKTVTAAAALTQGVDVSTPVHDTYTPPGGFGVIRNAGGVEGGGPLTQAISESSNTAFAEIALRTGGDAITTAAASLSAWHQWGTDHFGTAIDTGPNLDDPDALARTGFGQQGVRATPMAMAIVAGRIATNGLSLDPVLEAGTCSSSGDFVTSEQSPSVAPDELSNTIAEPIRDGMELAVSEGHAGVLDSLPFSVGAKTGTAEDETGSYDGWVMAYAPAEDPKYSVAVRIWADPVNNISRSGAADAAPVAASLLTAAMALPDPPNPCATH